MCPVKRIQGAVLSGHSAFPWNVAPPDGHGAGPETDISNLIRRSVGIPPRLSATAAFSRPDPTPEPIVLVVVTRREVPIVAAQRRTHR